MPNGDFTRDIPLTNLDGKIAGALPASGVALSQRSGLPCRIEASCSDNTHTLSARSWPLAPDGEVAGELRALGYQPADEASDGLLASIARLLARRLQIEMLQRSDQQRLVQEERAIIARELHDSLAQTLSTIRFQLTVARHQLHQDPVLAADRERLAAVRGTRAEAAQSYFASVARDLIATKVTSPRRRTGALSIR